VVNPSLQSCAGGLLLLATVLAPLRAEDWTTISGKVYKDVKVVKVEADAVTILDQDGGALVPLMLLPEALQKKFNYDPEKARLAGEARLKADQENQHALHVEMSQADQIKAKKDAESKAAVAAHQAGNAHHDTMPATPSVLEPQNYQDGDVLGKPK
jgi:hypothetical protein